MPAKSAIVLIYALDVALRDEAAVLKKLPRPSRDAAPDTAYKFVATPERWPPPMPASPVRW
jgi:hypothetical protein